MAQISTSPNRFYPSIPGITDDVATHRDALQQIREAIETHERRNNNYLKSFVRFEELVTLGIIDSSGKKINNAGTADNAVGSLDGISDVTISAPSNNDILGYDSVTAQWTAQNAKELNLATLDDVRKSGNGSTYLGGLSDVNIAGAQQHDLLYLADTGWTPTKNAIQTDGADLFLAAGDLHFFPIGGKGGSVIQDGNHLHVKIPGGSLKITATPYLDLINTTIRLAMGQGVAWSADNSSPYFLQYIDDTTEYSTDVGVLRANFDGRNNARLYTGEGNRVWTFAAANGLDKIVTTTKKFGTGSYRAGGYASGVYTSVEAERSKFIPGTKDWYAGFWLYPTGINWPITTSFITIKSSSGVLSRSIISFSANSGVPNISYNSTGGDGFGSSTSFGTRLNLSANTWSFIEFERAGNSMHCYINGDAYGGPKDCTGLDIGSQVINLLSLAVFVSGYLWLDNIIINGVNDGYLIDAVELIIGANKHNGAAPGTVPVTAPNEKNRHFIIGHTGYDNRINGSHTVVSEKLTVNNAARFRNVVNVDDAFRIGRVDGLQLLQDLPQVDLQQKWQGTVLKWIWGVNATGWHIANLDVLQARDGMKLQLRDAANADAIGIAHDGTNLAITADSGSTDNLDLHGGLGVRFRSPNNRNSCRLWHDGNAMNLDGNLAAGIRIFDTLGLRSGNYLQAHSPDNRGNLTFGVRSNTVGSITATNLIEVDWSGALLDMNDHIIQQAVFKDCAVNNDSLGVVVDANQTLDYVRGPVFELDLENWTTNRTITLSNAPANSKYGQITAKIRQDGTAPRSITWAGGSFIWAGGRVHAMNRTLNGVTVFKFETWDGGTTWFASGTDYN